MGALARDGVNLRFEQDGSGHPPIVFVHGWTCSHAHFAPQFDWFRRQHQVVAVDLRGHGSSDAPADGYSIPVLADDVAWISRQTGNVPAVVVGHSMGALVAIEMAARHPDAVSALVLVDPGPVKMTTETRQRLERFAEDLHGPSAQAMRRDFVTKTLFRPTDDRDERERVVKEMLQVPGYVASSCFRGMISWEGEVALKNVRVPVLAIHADRPINDPTFIASICPTLTNSHTPGVGHFNQLLAAEEVNRLISQFIVLHIPAQL